MHVDERYVAGVDYDEGEACGEGMCQCYCASVHACGCDCTRCAYCRQLAENCDCGEE